MTVCQASMYAC